MKDDESKYSVIFKEMSKLGKEPRTLLSEDELREHKEIRILREIVLEIENSSVNYQTTT